MRFRTRVAAGLATVPAEEQVASLVALTYELLDAHADTARIAGDDATDEEWRHHLDYLRDLQRVGREALARAGR
jgi:hypothetical protein